MRACNKNVSLLQVKQTGPSTVSVCTEGSSIITPEIHLATLKNTLVSILPYYFRFRTTSDNFEKVLLFSQRALLKCKKRIILSCSELIFLVENEEKNNWKPHKSERHS